MIKKTNQKAISPVNSVNLQSVESMGKGWVFLKQGRDFCVGLCVFLFYFVVFFLLFNVEFCFKYGYNLNTHSILYAQILL